MAQKTLDAKMKRYAIMRKHMYLTKHGEYAQAKNLLILLNRGYVNLRLGDDDAKTEIYLEKLGCRVFYTRNFNIARFSL